MDLSIDIFIYIKLEENYEKQETLKYQYRTHFKELFENI